MRPELRKTWYSIAVVCIAAALWITYWSLLRDVGGDRLRCMSNLRVISTQSFLYAARHGGTLPRSLGAVRAFGRLDADVFRCPVGADEGERPELRDYATVLGLPGAPRNLAHTGSPGRIPMVGDRRRFHEDGEGDYALWVMMDGRLQQKRGPTDEVLGPYRNE
jgi:hypothetical protein